MTLFSALTQAIKSPDNQPHCCWQALDDIVQSAVGAKLFTAMTFDASSGLASRVYTNDPVSYPTAGTKPIGCDDWTAHVIDAGKTFVANDIGAISRVFSDYELIQSLGCESAVNVPIFVNGSMLGSINLLHEAGYYTDARVAAAESLTLPASACFLVDRLVTGNNVAQAAGDTP